MLSRFRHYRNLHVTERRLRQLLADFRFGPMQHALSSVTDANGLASEPAWATPLPYLW